MNMRCPHCDRVLGHAPQLVGMRVKCPFCENHFIMREDNLDVAIPQAALALPGVHPIAPNPTPPRTSRTRPTNTASNMLKVIAVLLCAMVGLLLAILILVLRAKSDRVSIADLDTDERRAYAGLEMLAVADAMPTEFARQIWRMATTMIHDGYVNDGEPLTMTIEDLTQCTGGVIGLAPPDNGLFPISWKLMRGDRGDDSIPPSWLSCESAGSFCYDLHDRISTEWMRAIRLFPREDWDAGLTMFSLAASLHEKQANDPERFASEVSTRRQRFPAIQIDYSIHETPYMFDLVLSYGSETTRLECRVCEDIDGSRVIMQMNCLRTTPPVLDN